MPGSAVPAVQVPSNAVIKLRGDLRLTPQELGQGPCYLIEDPLRSKFYRIGIREFTLVSLLDGNTTLGEAIGLTATALAAEALAESEALALADWLVACQLVEGGDGFPEPGCSSAAPPGGQTQPVGWLRQLCREPLFIKLPLANPDRMLDAALPWCGWLLGRWFLALWCVVAASGICCAISHGEQLLSQPFAMLDPGNWARLLLAWCCLTLWHEAFHAVACKKFGGAVPRAGVAFLMFMPAAFVDVTSCWRFGSKWQRITVAAAGMYAELFVASLALLVWARTHDGVTHRFCYDLALLASVGTVLFNGNPLLRFDGYYIFSDLLDIPNLAPLSRQYVSYLVRRHVLGFDVVAPALPPQRNTFVKCYALASAGWRSLLTASICLWVIGAIGCLGALLVAWFAIFHFLLPSVRELFRMVRSGMPLYRSRRQWVLFGSGIGLVVIVGCVWLAGQSTIYAPAVVEYSPLTIVRAVSPGFVQEVLVQNGAQVRACQLLVRLENDELRAELAEIELAAEKCAIQGRIHHQNGEIAKYQIEDTKRKTLEKKKGELQRQVEALEVRAPAAGQLIGRDLETLIGRYVKPGTEIATIGDEASKELMVAIVQDDIDIFAAHLGQEINVRVWGTNGTFQAVLQKVEPSARVDAPHASLSSQLGGPLPVKARAVKQAAIDHNPWELLRPVFIGKILLSPLQSRDWQAGQLATVSFQSATQNRWGRAVSRFEQRINEQLERADRTTP